MTDRKKFWHYYCLQRAIDTLQNMIHTYKDVQKALSAGGNRDWCERAQEKVQGLIDDLKTEIEDRIDVQSSDSIQTDSEFRDTEEDMIETVVSEVEDVRPKVAHDSAFKGIFQLQERHQTHMRLRGSGGDQNQF